MHLQSICKVSFQDLSQSSFYNNNKIKLAKFYCEIIISKLNNFFDEGIPGCIPEFTQKKVNDLNAYNFLSITPISEHKHTIR